LVGKGVERNFLGWMELYGREKGWNGTLMRTEEDRGEVLKGGYERGEEARLERKDPPIW
jgi:hypothetical protein